MPGLASSWGQVFRSFSDLCAVHLRAGFSSGGVEGAPVSAEAGVGVVASGSPEDIPLKLCIGFQHGLRGADYKQ
jgi:hypothetical protein